MKLYHENIMTRDFIRRVNNSRDRASDVRVTMHRDIADGNAKAAACAYSEGEYKEVANLPDGNCLKSLEAAWVMTQNLTDGGWVWEIAQAKILRRIPEYVYTSVIGGSARSTSVCDIIERQGIFYLVARTGFTELRGLTIKSAKELWT